MKKKKEITSELREIQIQTMIESSQNSSLNFTKSRDPQDISEMMVKIVEHLFAIPRKEFTSQSRERDNVVRRCLVCNLIFAHTNLRDTAIGKIVNRDRTSVLHMFRLHEDLMFSDAIYREWFQKASSMYARCNHLPDVSNSTLDDIIQKIINLNNEVETLNSMLGSLLISKNNVIESTEQSLVD